MAAVGEGVTGFAVGDAVSVIPGFDLNDYGYSGETLTFTFFVNVAGPLDYLYIAAPSAAALAAGIAATLVFLKRKNKQVKLK